MIKLIKADIVRYKCIEKEQSFNIEDDVTVLVGMNESGKTSILEALSKTNYFLEPPTSLGLFRCVRRCTLHNDKFF